jgi:hypothetical protein
VEKKDSPLGSVAAFIGSTGVDIARPSGSSQRSSYSVHKRQTCLKFQAISARAGFFSPVGPVEGRRHDMFLYNESSLDKVFRSTMYIYNMQYYLYVDSA